MRQGLGVRSTGRTAPLVLCFGLAWGAQAGPVDATSPSAGCALVRDALSALDTRWPHRERAFSRVGSPPVPDSALTPGLILDRVPPDRERFLGENGPDRIVIGEDVYVSRGENWTRDVGAAVGGPRWTDISKGASDCAVTGTQASLVARFRVRIGSDLVAAGILRLRQDGKPSSLDLETPLPGGLVFRDAHRFEYPAVLTIDAPPVLSEVGGLLPAECSGAQGGIVRGEYTSPDAGFAVTIPSPLSGCVLGVSLINDGVVIPLRAADGRAYRGSIQVNAITGLVHSLDEAIAMQRAIFDAYASDSAAGAWEVSEARAGGLGGKRIRFWASNDGRRGPQQLDIVILERGLPTEFGPIFYQIYARVPLAMAATEAPVLESVIGSFRTVDVLPLPDGRD